MNNTKDQLLKDWTELRNGKHQPIGDTTAQRFSPKDALAYALRLAEATDEDEARTNMQSRPQGSESFYVAAHFALPYLLSRTDRDGNTHQSRTVPFVALASGVVSFLQALQSQYGQTISEDEA